MHPTPGSGVVGLFKMLTCAQYLAFFHRPAACSWTLSIFLIWLVNNFSTSFLKGKVLVASSIKYFPVFLIAVVFFNPLYASSMDGRGLARMIYDRDDGQDSYATIKMLLIDKGGKKRLRQLVAVAKDYGKLAKSFTRFTLPADIEGTSFLTWENEDRDADQFLYLPALGRVRRIVSTQKSNRFVNTDYTYEDLERRKVDADNHRIIRAEKYKGYPCRLLESTPKNLRDSQYGKRLIWVAEDIFVPIKIEYYDKRERPTKIYNAQKLEKIDGIWTVIESEMHDLKRKHRTLMKIEKILYNRGIPDRVFTKGYMLHSK
jgi:hypothetical protein